MVSAHGVLIYVRLNIRVAKPEGAVNFDTEIVVEQTGPVSVDGVRAKTLNDQVSKWIDLQVGHYSVEVWELLRCLHIFPSYASEGPVPLH